MRSFFGLCAGLMLVLAPATAHEETGYAPMAPFAKLAGHTLRGVGTSPGGERLVDIAKWELILGGKALQSTHRLQGGDYGGRTIFFYDEGAETYVFHYFTTAGFHTTGTAEPIEDGFVATEEVHGDKRYKQVRSIMTFNDDETIDVESIYVLHDGSETPGSSFRYSEVEDAGPLFD
ncbi:MAG: hypothetical protein AAFV51_14385 [Pseudomonadota bacterium]